MSDASILSDFIDLDTLAAEANVSRRTCERWCDATSPGLPYTRLGRRRLVRRADFTAWLAARTVRRNPGRR